MSDRDEFLTWVNTALYEAERALHNGEPAARRALWSRNEPVSVLGAWRNAIGQRTRRALHLSRRELLEVHVVRIRAARVRRGRRHGVYRRLRAHLGVRRRPAPHVQPAGHA